ASKSPSLDAIWVILFLSITAEGIVIVPFKKSYTESFRGLVKGKLSLEELEKLYAEKS
ncbi:hypothetical protein HKBW3S09_01889, partial [Candidatus Hakubella thermalkaliphila]